MAVECLAQEFGLVDSETIGPLLGMFGLAVVDSEAQHRHTRRIRRMTASNNLYECRS